MLESFEPRVLLTTYTYTSAVEAFHLETLVRPIEGPGAASFGAVVVATGDLDGDGANDFAVAAPGELGEDGRYEGDAGAVFVYSGRTRALLRTLSDGLPGFGASMVNIGDANGDGVADLAVGSPSADHNLNAAIDYVGSVTVYSGADGAVVWSRNGESRLDELGWAVALAGDVNEDGVTDVIVGAPGAGGDGANTGAGAAFVLSGVDGAVLHTFTGETAGDRFGSAVDGGVDVPEFPDHPNGDGFIDFLVGAPARDNGAGAAYLIDGSDGSVRLTYTDGAGAEAGAAVAFVGYPPGRLNDLDFFLRIAVGSPGYNDGSGRVVLHTSGDFNNTPIPSPEAGARFGSRIFTLDIIDPTSTARYYSITAPAAASGNTLYTLPGNTTNAFPLTGAQGQHSTSLAFLGDVDADGNFDFVGGYAAASGAGEARVMPYILASDHFASGVWLASDNGLNFVISASGDPFGLPRFEGAPFQGFVILNGQIIPLGQIPGLPADGIIQGINNDGAMFGYRGAALPSGFRSLSSQFILRDGQYVSLDDAITSVVGVRPDGVTFVELANNGDAIFRGFTAGADGVSTDGVPRNYVLRDGVLTELWRGGVLDINSSGAIIGFSETLGHVVRSSDGMVSAFANFVPRFILDDGSIIGTVATNTRNDVAIWRAGSTTVLSSSILPPPQATSSYWIINAADNNGRIAARYEWVIPGPGRPPSAYPGTNYLYTPEDGFEVAEDIVAGEPGVEVRLAGRLLDSGFVVMNGPVLLPIADSGIPDTNGATPTHAASGPTGLMVTARDQNGDIIFLRRDGVRFGGQVLSLGESFGEARDAVTYADSRDGRTYAVVRTSENFLVWFRQRSDSTFDEGVLLTGPGSEQIAGPISTFTSNDGRVHITGVSAEGHVLIYYQVNRFFEPDHVANWWFDDLTLHAREQGQAEPMFTTETELVGYATEWGGMNIAGINTEHEIEVLWWAPGQVYWSYDNLSESAGTPALHDDARLAPFVASWGAMHLAAVDADGRLQSTWWAPGLAEWQHNDLTTEFNGPALAPGSVTAYTTAWNGLNIAGISAESGEAQVHWWTPTTGGWNTETLDLGAEAPVFAGRLESAVRDNNLNIFGTTTEGELLRLFWYPSQGSVWNIEGVQASLN